MIQISWRLYSDAETTCKIYLFYMPVLILLVLPIDSHQKTKKLDSSIYQLFQILGYAFDDGTCAQIICIKTWYVDC